MRYMLKDTVLGNEIFIAYIHLHHSFTEKLDPFWPCDLEMDSDAEPEDFETLAQSDVAKLRVRNHILSLHELRAIRNVISLHLMQ